MKSAFRDRYGPPEVISIREVETPTPTDDRVLVRLKAASVNRADLDGLGPRWPFIRLFLGLRAPKNHRLGIDAAGVVEEVGPGVTRWKPGDRVFADLYAFGDGAFAEYACARERAFAAIPDGMTFEDAATLPHSAVLAVQGLRLRDGRTMKAGDKVLIDGASGNVGPFAVQIAKARGADVTGTCRTEKLDFVRSLGADHVLDYTTVDYTRTGERYDWILETDAHHSLFAIRRALKPGGVHMSLGGSMGALLSYLFVAPILSRLGGRRVGLMTWWAPFKAADVATLLAAVADGTVRPHIDRRFPLDEIVPALRWVADGHARGKVVITI